MDSSDLGKLFIGGISWETTEEKLAEYFGQYGQVLSAVIMRDKITNRPRGFGFVAFADPSILDRVLADNHNIDGRTVEAKRALSREEQSSTRSGNSGVGGAAVGGGGRVNIRTKKIFVGGLPATVTEDILSQYFQNYGEVTDVVVMYDSQTHRPRGFGFITFSSEDSVDQVFQDKNFHELNGKLVEVKRALPKDMNPTNGGGRSVGGGKTYQSYGGSGGNTTSYEVRTEPNRYVQPTYGSSGYGAPGYGYGPANNGLGYGGYGAGGYGSALAGGYNGPAGGTYGNPNAPTSGYTSGPPVPPRSPWNNQPTAGFDFAGYGGNTGYGPASSWNAPAGGNGIAAPPIGQSPSGASGYGNQGYGHVGYASGGRGNLGPNNSAGSAGEQGAGSVFMGTGYGDGNGNSGHQASWRSDPSQVGGYGAGQVNGPPGGSSGYGSGYGADQSRQVQYQ